LADVLGRAASSVAGRSTDKFNYAIMVRPGITGWAQVNGGTLLTPKKGGMDEWYLRNASLWFDIRIFPRPKNVMNDGDVRSAYVVSPTLARIRERTIP
jgi:lipopolysaccharide/colanic/teichoic acid biosynthesis glycosyltransferase